MRVVYMGTPGFACQPLEALHRSEHEVLAVVTGQAKRRGRRGQPCPTDVCCSAQDLGLPILTPKTLKSKKLHAELAALKPDLFVVVAFRILPESLFTLPKYGSINIHGSLLPKYRGAAPINWALINGEKTTGLTSFFLNQQVDTGNMILQESVAIEDDDNFDSLYARMSAVSGPFLLRTLDQIRDPNFRPMAQDDTQASPAPKLTPFDTWIDFGFPADKVRNFIRGLSTRPGARTTFRDKQIKILAAAPAGDTADDGLRPGSIIPDRRRLLVACARSVLELTELVPEGKRPMDGASFINGFKPGQRELFGEARKEVKRSH